MCRRFHNRCGRCRKQSRRQLTRARPTDATGVVVEDDEVVAGREEMRIEGRIMVVEAKVG